MSPDTPNTNDHARRDAAHDSDDTFALDLTRLAQDAHDGAPLRATWDADGHPDEGSLHAYLDGAFDTGEAARIEAHVTGCATCAASLAEARGLLAASARILGTLDHVSRGVVPADDVRRAAAAMMVPPPRRVPWFARPMWRAAAVLFVAAGAGAVYQQRERVAAGAVADSAEKAAAANQPLATTGAPAVPLPAPSAAPEAAPATPSVAATSTAEARARRADSATSNVASSIASSVAVPSPIADAAPAADRVARAADLSAEKSAERVAERATQIQPAPAAPQSAASGAAPVPAPAVALARSAPAFRPFIVRGQVVHAGTLRPVDAATVSVSRASGASLTGAARAGANALAIVRADVDGRFRAVLANVSDGDSLVLSARRIGYEQPLLRLRVQGDSLVVQVTLTPSVTMLSSIVTTEAAKSGVSYDAQGRGVAGGIARGVEVRAVRPQYAMPAATTSPSVRNGVVRPVPGQFPGVGGDREQYDRIVDNPFLAARDNPLSTFSIDVDRAAFGNVRRFLTQGQRPPKDAVRIEELVNWFPYDLPAPRGSDPVAITTEVMAAPWQPRHQLVRVALQSERIATADLPPSNLVFLIDVSGSMQSDDKLPLVKQSLRLLVDQLRPQDHVAIVAYAGAAGLVLPSTSGDEKVRIIDAIDRLEAGGSTAGGAGIELAYRVAREHFRERGNNRVILATDGDFNVGVSSDGELERLIERKRAEGTYLTVLGFGTGNLQDAKMAKLAKVGNGNYAYVDELAEARKVFVQELGATLVTVANDVKLQVEFNPTRVQAYRLIGYEDRLLRTEDFNDDRKDAGDLGAGHQVTALYEVVPVGVTGTVTLRAADSLRYATPAVVPPSVAGNGELAFVKLRYKRPGENTSRLLSHAVPARTVRGSADARFAAAVASFGMLLRDSEYAGTSSAAQVLEQARAALGEDAGGYRAAFLTLVERWRSLGRARE